MKNAALFLEAETARPRPGVSRQTACQENERRSQVPATALSPPTRSSTGSYVAVAGGETQLDVVGHLSWSAGGEALPSALVEVSPRVKNPAGCWDKA